MDLPQHIPIADLHCYVRGGLDRIEATRVRAHCEQCQHCEDYRDAIAVRRAQSGKIVADGPLSQGECFSGATIAKYANPNSDLTNDERALIRDHLTGCFICQTELELAFLGSCVP